MLKKVAVTEPTSSINDATLPHLERTHPTPMADKKRVTVILTETLDRNLDFCAAAAGKGKSEIVYEVLCEYVKKLGLDPSRVPRLESLV